MFVLITIAMESFSMFGENLQKEISVRMYSGHEEVAESLHPPPLLCCSNSTIMHVRQLSAGFCTVG